MFVSASIAPFRLEPFYSPRPWGALDLAPWLHHNKLSEPIGEAWFTGGDSVVATGKLAGQGFSSVMLQHASAILGEGSAPATEYPLLIKLLFPKQKLSVQVHPDDTFAQRMGFPRGKTECWYVLDAAPGAAIALGFKTPPTRQQIEIAVASETLEDLLDWIPVHRGEMIFVDAGTVHAIGPGVVLLEVQQQSDLTYRLYDYGRGRELHLELGLAALRAQTSAGKVTPQIIEERTELISTKYFKVERMEVSPGGAAECKQSPAAQAVFIVNGTGAIETGAHDALSLDRGQLAIIPAATPPWRLTAEASGTRTVAIVASSPNE